VTVARSTPVAPAREQSAIDADTVAALLRRLGDVPAWRVLLHPAPGTATEVDLLRRVETAGRQCELVEGTLVEKPMGLPEGVLEAVICEVVGNFVRTRRLGFCGSSSSTLRMLGGNIRLPDICYFAWEDVPERRVPQVAVPKLAPTLAIEVLSEGNTADEMKKKRSEYFESGTRRVWEFDPRARTVDVYRPTAPESPRRLEASATLEGEDVLPGFSVKLAELFSALDSIAPEKVGDSADVPQS
jgi:Uma2 family endonuclease